MPGKVHRNLFKTVFFLTIIFILGSCSEDAKNFPNLSEVGKRPDQPSLAQINKEIQALKQKRKNLKEITH